MIKNDHHLIIIKTKEGLRGSRIGVGEILKKKVDVFWKMWIWGNI